MEKKKNKKSKALIIIPILLLAAAGAVYYFFFLGSGGVSGDPVYVQTLAQITGSDSGALTSGRFSGMVEARNLSKIKLDTGKSVDTCFVSVGDSVSAGTPLFSYDTDKLTLDYEQLKLDIEGKKNNIATYVDEIEKLDKQIKKARKPATQAELTVQRQTAELKRKKDEYELKTLQQKADATEAILSDNVVRSTVGGKVRAINPPPAEGETSSASANGDNSYITIVVGNDLRVTGSVSEQNVLRLAVGTEVTVRSRLDAKKTWPGHIEEVNTQEPVKSQNDSMYGMDTSEKSSKYAFYVALDTADELIIGQHVYIDLGRGDTDPSVLMIPEGYVGDAGTVHPWVYAANTHNRIEKRSVSLGRYDADTNCYEVLSGLTASDRIAAPDETVTEGSPAVDAGYVSADGGSLPEGLEPGEDILSAIGEMPVE